MKTHTFFVLLFLFSIGQVFAQFNKETDSIPSLFMEQLTLYPQEKVFVHTDKSSYAAGDTVWLRAHLADAATHIPSPVSRYVYVELADCADSIVSRIKIRMNDSIYYGQMPLEEFMPQGYYTLRAYTKFMQNLPEDYIFKSTISITNAFIEEKPNTSVSEDIQSKDKTSSRKKSTPFDVQFFPEGGYLPANILWRVAFKAIREDGWNEHISGKIKDKATGELVATLPTPYLGMGYVTFMPQEGKQYIAECLNEQNIFVEFDLPPVTPNAQVLTTSWRKNMLMVSCSKPITAPIRLVMQSRGIVFYSSLWEASKRVLAFDAKLLPAGVIQVLLVDDNNQPISERLVFNKDFKEAQLSLTTNQTEHERGETIKADVSLSNNNGAPLRGDFSVSVTDDEFVNTNNATSILSYLLLTSELKGTIEFPEAYFDTTRAKATQELDVLMMTQGWRRYDISKILKREYEQPSIMLERCQEVTGRVTSGFSSKAKINAPVALLALEHLFSDETLSDSTGHFRFTRFEFPDSTNFIVRGTTKKGKNSDIILKLDKESFYPFGKSKSIADLYNRKYIKEEHIVDTLNSDGMRMIQLDEVVIKARKKEEKEKNRYGAFTKKVFNSNDNKFPLPSTLGNLLTRLSGIMVLGDKITLRGKTPLILVDNFECESEQVINLPSDDIDEIELMQDASTVLFGARGSNGVILITSKTGYINQANVKPNVATISPLGYQNPAEFYSPKYIPTLANNAQQPSKRTTIYWNPNIRLSDRGEAQFEFYTPKKQTNHTLIIQGLSYDGKVIYKKLKF